MPFTYNDPGLAAAATNIASIFGTPAERFNINMAKQESNDRAILRSIQQQQAQAQIRQADALAGKTKEETNRLAIGNEAIGGLPSAIRDAMQPQPFVFNEDVRQFNESDAMSKLAASFAQAFANSASDASTGMGRVFASSQNPDVIRRGVAMFQPSALGPDFAPTAGEQEALNQNAIVAALKQALSVADMNGRFGLTEQSMQNQNAVDIANLDNTAAMNRLQSTPLTETQVRAGILSEMPKERQAAIFDTQPTDNRMRDAATQNSLSSDDMAAVTQLVGAYVGEGKVDPQFNANLMETLAALRKQNPYATSAEIASEAQRLLFSKGFDKDWNLFSPNVFKPVPSNPSRFEVKPYVPQ